MKSLPNQAFPREENTFKLALKDREVADSSKFRLEIKLPHLIL